MAKTWEEREVIDPANQEELAKEHDREIDAATPGGQIKTLRQRAALIDIEEVPEIDEAEQLLDEWGGFSTNKKSWIFRELLHQARRRIDHEAYRKDEERLLPLAQRAQPFIDGPKKERSDTLGMAVELTFGEFHSEHGRIPSAKELWAALPKSEHVQEKDEDTVYWKRANGKEETTSFKSFKTRYTSVKKKMQTKKK
jgi:hypothetical protein